MSDTPKKKAPAKKAPAKKAPAKKVPAKGATPAKRGRPPKAAIQKDDKVFSGVDEFIDELNRIAEEPKKDTVVVRANDVRTVSLRKRMLKWFKK